MSSEIEAQIDGEELKVETNEDGLTNKERRLARKAEKQAARKSEGMQGEKKRKTEEEEEKEEVENEKEDEEEEEEEVDAISHKERRKRRKLEKQAAKKDSQSADPSSENAENTKIDSDKKKPTDTAIQRSPFSLWVGNLSFRTSPSRLQEWFETNELFGITRVYMPKGAKKFEYNRGFAYVDVPSEEAMRKGISLSEINLDGRRLLIKAGSDFGGRPSIDSAARALAEGTMNSDAADEYQTGEGMNGKRGKTGLTKTAQKILRSQKHPPGPTLFIGNLSFNATEEGVRDMIERSAALRNENDNSIKAKQTRKPIKSDNKEKEKDGEEDGSSSEDDEKATKEEVKSEKPGVLRGAGIRKIRMGEFEDTGKCKGFSFVDFHSAAYATATLIDPRNSHLDGRELIVQYAGAEAIRRGAPKGKAGSNMNDNGYRRKSFETRQQRTRDFQQKKEVEDRAILAETAPAPGTFDIDQPLPKKHKETKEERIKRRENDNYKSSRRMKPGAALAQAQRGKVAIDVSAPQGKKMTFDNDDGED